MKVVVDVAMAGCLVDVVLRVLGSGAGDGAGAGAGAVVMLAKWDGDSLFFGGQDGEGLYLWKKGVIEQTWTATVSV